MIARYQYLVAFPLLGETGSIPWAVAKAAYAEYVKRYGNRQSLQRIAERGGFSIKEMDDLLPDWRDRIAIMKSE